MFVKAWLVPPSSSVRPSTTRSIRSDEEMIHTCGVRRRNHLSTQFYHRPRPKKKEKTRTGAPRYFRGSGISGRSFCGTGPDCYAFFLFSFCAFRSPPHSEPGGGLRPVIAHAAARRKTVGSLSSININNAFGDNFSSRRFRRHTCSRSPENPPSSSNKEAKNTLFAQKGSKKLRFRPKRKQKRPLSSKKEGKHTIQELNHLSTQFYRRHHPERKKKLRKNIGLCFRLRPKRKKRAEKPPPSSKKGGGKNTALVQKGAKKHRPRPKRKEKPPCSSKTENHKREHERTRTNARGVKTKRLRLTIH